MSGVFLNKSHEKNLEDSRLKLFYLFEIDSYWNHSHFDNAFIAHSYFMFLASKVNTPIFTISMVLVKKIT